MNNASFVRRIVAALAFALASAQFVTFATARADTTGSWAGTVAYINRTHVGVKNSHQTKDFLIPSNFTNVKSQNGKLKPLSDVTVGSYVTVRYLQSPLFGSTRVTEIDFGTGFHLKSSLNPIQSMAPLPTPSNSPQLP